MTELTGRFILMSEDEYNVLLDEATAHREKSMTSEEREIIAEALTLLSTHDFWRMIQNRGGRINGRTLSDRQNAIRKLMAKFDR